MAAIGIATQRIVHHFSEDAIVAEYFQILDTKADSLNNLYIAFRDFWLRLLASNAGTAPAAAQAGTSAITATAEQTAHGNKADAPSDHAAEPAETAH